LFDYLAFDGGEFEVGGDYDGMEFHFLSVHLG